MAWIIGAGGSEGVLVDKRRRTLRCGAALSLRPEVGAAASFHAIGGRRSSCLCRGFGRRPLSLRLPPICPLCKRPCPSLPGKGKGERWHRTGGGGSRKGGEL